MTSSNKVFIFSYNPHSEGAKNLAKETGFKRVKHQGSSFRGGPGTVLINWGSAATLPSYLPGTKIINPPQMVSRSSNKRSFFQEVAQGNCRIPDWTCDPNVARQWIDQGAIVVARTILNGHSGAGIEILELGRPFVEAPLYTKYVKKEKEFRVHFAFGSQIDVQRKIKRPDFIGEPNWRVRNHQNGFIYVRDNIVVPQDVFTQALQAFTASGLDFGAVDVIWNEYEQKAYVLEINTAPGITGRSVQGYKEAFLKAPVNP